MSEEIEYDVTISGFDPVRVSVPINPKSTQRYRSIAMVAAQSGLLDKMDIKSIWDNASTKKAHPLPATGGKHRVLPILSKVDVG